MSPSARDLLRRIDEFEQELKYLTEQAAQDEIARLKLLDITRMAPTLIETPWETISRMYMESGQNACVRASLEMGLVEAVANGAKTAAELASITKCDERLIVRILRPLCYLKIFSEEGFETYGPTKLTNTLLIPTARGGFKFMYDQCATCVFHLPEYLAKTGFKEPHGGCFKSAFNTELDLFQWLKQHPEQSSNFNECMAGQRLTRVAWFDFCSVPNVLMNGYIGGDTPLLVDIGGNLGYDLQGLKKLFPDIDWKGKLILQELPWVLDDITDLDEEIIKMEYNFFKPQPVKGARAYYMRYVLHDYSDEQCREILLNTVLSMTRGYSKLLIYEFVLPDVGAPLFASLLDINLMAVLSGMERTERQWVALLDSVGLEIVHIRKCGDSSEGLIEATLKS